MPRILLVHDGDVVMNALGLVLEREGYEVAHAGVLAEREASTANLVLVDAHAALFDRHGAVADLRLQMNLRAPLYLFSSDSEEELRARADYLGADGYVCTEWGFKRLISVVRFTVRRKLSSGPPRAGGDIALNTMNRVLVIDDHTGARDRLMLELRNQGYVVAGCGSLATLQPVLDKLQPDVIVADVVLPGVPGDEICRSLKAHMTNRLIPIVLISGLSEDELRARAERAGADGYFRKQDGLPKLIQMLERLLSEIIF
ncbi:MAG TPA: response regulator [Polyangiales bacterium]